MTLEVFGQAPVLRTEIDPEAGDQYIVVEVCVQGSDEDVFSQTQVWHRRLAREFAAGTSYALSPLFAG